MPAHPQMREVMVPLLKEFKKRIPIVFDDILPYWSVPLSTEGTLKEMLRIHDIVDSGDAVERKIPGTDTTRKEIILQ